MMPSDRYGKRRRHNFGQRLRNRSTAGKVVHRIARGDFQQGYSDGYVRGVAAGQSSFDRQFDGTSIVIPTYNQRDIVLQCIASIEAHTTQPYEIIVVDDGSVDGTAEAIRNRSGVRLALHEQNLGFARAVNTGLMMAKGSTIVLLNNDVIVTQRWLDNMLQCLNASDEKIVVGPVTNYISGIQQIDVAYQDMNEMAQFAAQFNQSDHSKWQDTDRLVGFCLLFHRSTFEEVGYFDEGYEVGNFEDDDWMIRLRLQGKKLKIAGDTFIHHIGSVTMKGLGEEGFTRVNVKNEHFFSEKWGDVHVRLQQRCNDVEPYGTRSLDYLPTHVWLRGLSDKLYWLEHGVKYTVAGEQSSEVWTKAVQISVIDLIQLPSGGLKWRQDESSKSGNAWEGSVFRSNGGELYQVDRGKRRLLMSEYTLTCWSLSIISEHEIPPKLLELPLGIPITPAVQLRSREL